MKKILLIFLVFNWRCGSDESHLDAIEGRPETSRVADKLTRIYLAIDEEWVRFADEQIFKYPSLRVVACHGESTDPSSRPALAKRIRLEDFKPSSRWYYLKTPMHGCEVILGYSVSQTLDAPNYVESYDFTEANKKMRSRNSLVSASCLLGTPVALVGAWNAIRTGLQKTNPIVALLALGSAGIFCLSNTSHWLKDSSLSKDRENWNIFQRYFTIARKNAREKLLEQQPDVAVLFDKPKAGRDQSDLQEFLQLQKRVNVEIVKQFNQNFQSWKQLPDIHLSWNKHLKNLIDHQGRVDEGYGGMNGALRRFFRFQDKSQFVDSIRLMEKQILKEKCLRRWKSATPDESIIHLDICEWVDAQGIYNDEFKESKFRSKKNNEDYRKQRLEKIKRSGLNPLEYYYQQKQLELQELRILEQAGITCHIEALGQCLGGRQKIKQDCHGRRLCEALVLRQSFETCRPQTCKQWEPGDPSTVTCNQRRLSKCFLNDLDIDCLKASFCSRPGRHSGNDPLPDSLH